MLLTYEKPVAFEVSPGIVSRADVMIYEACIIFNTNCVSFVATTCSLRYLTKTSHVEKRIALCGTQPLISRSNHTRITRMACTAVTLKRTYMHRYNLRLTDFTGKITLGTTVSKTNRI